MSRLRPPCRIPGPRPGLAAATLALTLLWGAGPAALAQPPRGTGVVAAPTARGPEPAGPASDAEAAPDVIHLTNGNRVQGHVAQETPSRIVLIKEMRRGSFTRATLPRSTIARIEYAPAPARTAMKARIAWWEEKARREALGKSELAVAPSTMLSAGWESGGRYIVVHSDVDAAFTRDVAFRLNSMYTQWLALFQREAREAPPTRMFALARQEDMTAILLRSGMTQQQIALVGGVYSPELDLGLVPIQSTESRRYAAWLDARPARDYERRRVRSHVRTERARAIATLYHETMHAFMHKQLFPAGAAVPVWLNEGMATYVEMLREDVTGLRTETVNPELYPVVRGALANRTLPGIRILVARQASIADHDTGDSAAAFYAASWSLAYFLNLERGGLGGDMYPRYVAALEAGTDPVAAFEQMTGEALARTEAAWHRAIPRWR